ncbi:MAG TPA: hypothetical protein VF476_14340, partial [Chitinophagaceae bacterium]
LPNSPGSLATAASILPGLKPTMPTDQAQEFLFQRIKELIPPDASMVDVVSGILHVSTDSAYRRIRGETPLVLGETQQLCQHFNLSLDHLFQIKKGSVLFQDVRVMEDGLTYREFLQGILSQLTTINSFIRKEIIYMSKDLPVFHNFYIKDLSAFRYFFWMKTHLVHPDFRDKEFEFSVLPPDIEKLSMNLTKEYQKIPSIEMWNTESINSTISQIEFSKDSGHFASSKDVKRIYEALEQTIYHLKEQAEYGTKFMPGENAETRKSNFKFFFNRVVLGDNTILATTDFVKTCFINYGHLNYIRTRDEAFCQQLYRDFDNLIKKSTLISQTSEKQRNVFFGIILNKITERKKNL